MTYELAKKLKDAGFIFNKNIDGSWKLPPTLEELIEACGEDFSLLSKVKDGWYCESYPNVKDVIGSTPSEAVANLWLALQDK